MTSVAFEEARVAVAEDVDAIESIYLSWQSELQSIRGGELFSLHAGDSSIRERFLGAVASEQVIAVSGLFDGVVFGYSLCELVTLSDGSRLGYLTDIVVDSPARSVGIGAAMMNFLLEQLREKHGCSYIDSRAFPGDRQTKNFFESFAVKARMLVMSREL